MSSFVSQLVRDRRMVISSNKQNTYGTQLADAALIHSVRFEGGQYPNIVKQYYSDVDLVKGHPFPSVRKEIQRDIQLAVSGPVYDFIAAWLGAFLLGKVVTTGVNPYTHTFTHDPSTTIMPVTTIYVQDTADVKTKYRDLAINTLRISGGIVGPVTYEAELIGSGSFTDVAMTPPALVDPVFILNNDADILIGPQAAPVSIKSRVRSWQVSLDAKQEAYRFPGSGLVAGFTRKGDLRASVSLQIAAKDVDDIRTLLINDTVRELQININSGAAAQLKMRFPKLVLRGQGAVEGSYVTWQLETDDTGVLKDATAEYIEFVAINAQVTYLVGA